MYRVLTIICIGFSCLPDAVAQSRDDEAFERELLNQKEQYESAVMDATLELRKRYLNRLLVIEERAALEGDYDSAMAVKQKRKLVGAYLDRHDQTRRKALEAAMIVLTIDAAECSGAIDMKPDYLGGWRTNKSRATWDFRGVERGRYEVLLHYSCTAEVKYKRGSDGKSVEELAGGEIEFGEHTSLLGVDPPIKHELIATENWNDYTEVSLGELTLKNVAPSFRLQVLKVLPQGLMRLKGIRLVPVLKDQETEERVQGSAFAELQKRHDFLLGRSRRLLEQEYAEALRALAEKAKEASDTKLAKEIRAELDQLDL